MVHLKYLIIKNTFSYCLCKSIIFYSIQPVHAEVQCDGRSTFIKPCSDTAVVLINGTKVREKTALHHLVSSFTKSLPVLESMHTFCELFFFSLFITLFY